MEKMAGPTSLIASFSRGACYCRGKRIEASPVGLPGRKSSSPLANATPPSAHSAIQGTPRAYLLRERHPRTLAPRG